MSSAISIFLTICVTAHAQLDIPLLRGSPWEQRNAPWPNDLWGQAVGLVKETTTLYLFSGQTIVNGNSVLVDTTYTYDIKTGNFTLTNITLPYGIVCWSSCIFEVSPDELFFIHHENGRPVLWSFDVKTNFFNRSYRIPNKGEQYGSCVAYGDNNKMYLSGGSDKLETSYYNTLESWDIRSDVINKNLSRMNQSRKYHACVYDPDSKAIYIFGGEDRPNHALTSIEKYNIQTDTWETVPANLTRPISRADVVAFRGAFVITGGWDPATSKAIQETELFDPKTNKVYLMKNLTTARGFASAVATNHEIFVFGGQDGDLTKGRTYEYLKYNGSDVQPSSDGGANNKKTWLEEYWWVLVIIGVLLLCLCCLCCMCFRQKKLRSETNSDRQALLKG